MCDFYQLSASPKQFTLLQQRRQLLLDTPVGLATVYYQGGGGDKMAFSPEFCGDPFKSCSLPPNKRIIPKKVNLGLIQAATSTFVLITRKFLSPSFENGFQLISHKIMELDPINVLKLNIKVTITDILVQKLHLQVHQFWSYGIFYENLSQSKLRKQFLAN